MQIHDLKKSNLSRDNKRVGRGGKRGKTAGKGMKGQNARQGNSKRPEMRDIIKKIPKLRGHGIHGNRPEAIMTDAVAINVSMIDSAYEAGETVSPKTLVAKGLASKSQGKLPEVKILGDGEISTKVSVVSCAISASAREKIEKAGGLVKDSVK